MGSRSRVGRAHRFGTRGAHASLTRAGRWTNSALGGSREAWLASSAGCRPLDCAHFSGS
jgi:hypothetical protein